jgi:hypothetical protein
MLRFEMETLEPEPGDRPWAGPLALGKPQEDPDPNPPPIYSRWEAGTTTFGPRGRIALTALILLSAVLVTVLVPSGLILLLFDLPMAIGALFVLRDVWRRDRIS